MYNNFDDKYWPKLSKHQKDGGRREAAGGEGEKGGGGGGGQRMMRRSLSGRVASAAKEQRARLYIMRRCVSMLVSSCWKD